MPRGRPRKNPLVNLVNEDNVNKIIDKTDGEINEDAIVTQSAPAHKYICERCGKSTDFIECINISHLTHVASWNREMPVSPKMCRECCREMSEAINTWYLIKGKGKFE